MELSTVRSSKRPWGVSELSLQMRCQVAACDCYEAHRSGWGGRVQEAL